MKNSIFLFIAIVALLSSCKKDGSSNSGNATGSVIVVNEGDFGHPQAAVSIYDPATKTVLNDIFKTVNHFALGDVLQDVYMAGDTAFCVLNNSQRIIVADAAHSFKYIDTIGMPGASPRYFLPVRGSKAYVTELYAYKIWIVDYHAHKVTGSIPVTGWTEQMIAYNGKVYVLEKTTPSGATVNKLLEIDPATDHITRTIDFASEPNSMVLTDQNKLVVLTSQQASPVVNASLNIVDPSSFTIVKKIDFSAASEPNYLRYSAFAHQLLYADKGIYSMGETDTVVPASASIVSNNWNIYGLNVNPTNGDIYIGDAVDFQQASRIMRYSASDSLIDAFNAGIGTNGFVFR